MTTPAAVADSAALEIRPLEARDRPQWEVLARGYKDFYRSPASDSDYDAAWRRLLAAQDVHGVAAIAGQRIVGIAHYLFHASAWADTVCYLQDMYTSPGQRRRGIGRALIEAVAVQAAARGAARFYWLTQEDNAVARALYERVAKYAGFIRYDHPLERKPS